MTLGEPPPFEAKTHFFPTWFRTMKLDTSTDPQVGYRPPGTLDSASALDRYDGPLSIRQSAHLLRRAGFGGTATEVDSATALGAEAAVDRLLHPSTPDVVLDDYPDTAALYDPKTRVATAQAWWLDRMLRTRHPLYEKMTLFWHGHFATSIRKVPPHLMVAQIDLLRARGLGSFATLLAGVSKDPAMLVWLDNRYNVKAHPNENYAREVMEIFTLGLGNYTESDVKNAARAFTGWSLDKNLGFIDRTQTHDDGVKTLLGRTGSFTGDDAIAIIVAQPIHQRFIARKLLEFFVYSDPEPELIEALAEKYALCGGDIAQTVGTILRSNVFFSPRAYRALTKSPIEYAIGTLRLLEVAQLPGDTVAWLRRMGQEPLAPPSVKGWDGGPAWINTSTLLTRFNYANRLAQIASAGLSPDTYVARAKGYDARRVLDEIARDTVSDDVTSDVREALVGYLQSAGATSPVPFGPENYQEKVRGALALALNLPSNQLN